MTYPTSKGRTLYPQELKDQVAGLRTVVQPLLYSIGRVELVDGTHVGTGFLVADGDISNKSSRAR